MRLTHLTKYVAVAGALGVPLALAAPAGATGGGGGSAFGVSASGLVNLPPLPAVSSAAQPHDKSLAELPPNPLVQLKILHVSATPGRARASVADLKIAKAALSAHLITARCAGGHGSSQLVRASLAGHRLAVGAAPNSTVAVQVHGVGTVSVTLNKQVRDANGRLTVTAIALSLPIAPGTIQTVDISSATCGVAGGPPGDPGEPTTSPSPTPTPSAPPGEAPTPTPVPGDLPVTG